MPRQTRGSKPKARPPASSNRGHRSERGLKLHLSWAEAIPEQEWSVYCEAMATLGKAGIRFLLGGGFAQAAFTGRWRRTKDMDFYILPSEHQAAAAALASAGFDDYYERLAYDRKWIYRSVRSEVIVDIIWAMANQRTQVDQTWFDRAQEIRVRGQRLNVIPMEEFAWCKLYILQRDRCDWVDLLNLLYTAGQQLDWKHLESLVGDDLPLLEALLTVFAWVHPRRAQDLPVRRPRRPSSKPPGKASSWRERVRLLDSRAWFAGLRDSGQKLDI